MRKYVILFLCLIILLLSQSNIFAQESSPTPSPTLIKYDLAYPGMLPDNPLYKLKILRDKISEGLISDPRKKIDFYLLQTDKGILATAILVDKKEIELAAQTALKAENNYTLLTYQLYRLQKKLDSNSINKLKTAALKHQEILESLAKRVSGDKNKIFLTVRDFSKTNVETINKFQESFDLLQ